MRESMRNSNIGNVKEKSNEGEMEEEELTVLSL